METYISPLFMERHWVQLVRTKLPSMFKIADIESSRNGKIGMEVGGIRERILIALLMRVFGPNNVVVDTPITQPEIDVKLFNHPISIKTVTGSGGVKLIWTVDAQKAREFMDNYSPTCDILLAQIFWGQNLGGLFFIPKAAQLEILRKLGREGYLALPKQGTNPRGVSLTANALRTLLANPTTLKIPVTWVCEEPDYDIYARWLSYWSSD